MLPALTYRNMARLHATATLLTLSLPVSQDGEKWLLETLQGQQRAGIHMEPQRLQLCTHLASSPGLCSVCHLQYEISQNFILQATNAQMPRTRLLHPGSIQQVKWLSSSLQRCVLVTAVRRAWRRLLTTWSSRSLSSHKVH